MIKYNINKLMDFGVGSAGPVRFTEGPEGRQGTVIGLSPWTLWEGGLRRNWGGDPRG